MQRGKLRALLVDNQGRISIRRLKECPARLPGFIRIFVRTASDVKGGLFIYEQQREPLLDLADVTALPEALAAARKKLLLDGMSQEVRR